MSEANSVLPAEQSLQQFVLGLVRSLCDQPEQASVVADQEQEQAALHVSVAESDLGRLLGKGGRTARSLRTIVGAAAGKSGNRCTLDLRSAE